MSKPNPLWTEEFAQFRQVFGLHRFKLHRHLVDGTVKSVWFKQVFGLDRFPCICYYDDQNNTITHTHKF